MDCCFDMFAARLWTSCVPHQYCAVVDAALVRGVVIFRVQKAGRASCCGWCAGDVPCLSAGVLCCMHDLHIGFFLVHTPSQLYIECVRPAPAFS